MSTALMIEIFGYMTGRNLRKVDGLFLSPFSKKEVTKNGKTEKP